MWTQGLTRHRLRSYLSHDTSCPFPGHGPPSTARVTTLLPSCWNTVPQPQPESSELVLRVTWGLSHILKDCFFLLVHLASAGTNITLQLNTKDKGNHWRKKDESRGRIGIKIVNLKIFTEKRPWKNSWRNSFSGSTNGYSSGRGTDSGLQSFRAGILGRNGCQKGWLCSLHCGVDMAFTGDPVHSEAAKLQSLQKKFQAAHTP